jgi:hypothetical protein
MLNIVILKNCATGIKSEAHYFKINLINDKKIANQKLDR